MTQAKIQSADLVITFPKSIKIENNIVELIGDEETPTGIRYYGTNSAGEKGWHILASANVENGMLALQSEGLNEDDELNTPAIVMGNVDDPDNYVFAQLYSPSSKVVINAIGTMSDLLGDMANKFYYLGNIEATRTLQGLYVISPSVQAVSNQGQNVGGGSVNALLGNKLIDVTGTLADSGRSSDWDGRYLFVGTYVDHGTVCPFKIYDCDNRLNPVLITGNISGIPQEAIKGVRYYNDYVYITFAAAGGDAFRVVDVSTRNSPVVVGGAGLITFQDLGGGATLDMDTANSIVYVAGSTHLYSVDVSNPASPAILDTLEDVAATSLWTCKYSAGYCYVGGRDGNDAGNTLHIIDVSTPTAMVEVVPTEPIECYKGIWTLIVDGNYVYMACGGNFTVDLNPKFVVVDISDKANPQIVASLPIATSPSSYLRKLGDYIYMTNWAINNETGVHNLYCININDPLQPYIANSVKVGSQPLNCCPVDAGAYVYVLFAPFGGPPPYVGVVDCSDGGINGHKLTIGNTTINETQLQALLALL